MTRRHPFSKDQRIRLKGQGQDYMYQFAYAGSPGWVRKTDFDRVGVPMVYVEWDKKHWTYNGEQDEWTFADHFEPVEESKVSNDPDPKLMEFFRAYQAFQEEQELSNGVTGNSDDVPDEGPFVFDDRVLPELEDDAEEDEDFAGFKIIDGGEGAGDLIRKLLEDAKAIQRDPIGSLIDNIPWADREAYSEALADAAARADGDEGFLLVSVQRDETGHLQPMYSQSFITPEAAIVIEAQLSRMGAISHADATTTLVNLLTKERERREEHNDTEQASD